MVKRNNLVTRAFCLQGGKSGWKINEDDPEFGLRFYVYVLFGRH